jgi:hypothetical protein
MNVLATLTARLASWFGVGMFTHYLVECWAPCALCLEAGRPHQCEHRWLRWSESVYNIVVTEGLNLLLTRAFKTIAPDVNWYVGLKNSGTPVAGDTMASHGSWSENTTYTEGTRPAWTAGSVSGGSVDNSAAKAVFSINGTTTVYGAFLSTNNTKSGTTGTLYGVADFSASRSVASGDTLNVQVTLTATSA